MEKMSTLTFPDGSTYEVVDEKARKEISDLSNNVRTMHTAISTDKTLLDSCKGGLRLLELHGNTVQNKDILKYTGGAVSIESKKTFTYELPTPLVIEPNEKYTIVLENMNGGSEYSPSDTYAEILFSDSIGTLLYPWVLVGSNTMGGEIGVGNIAKIQITAKTSSLTFSSIRIEHDATPDYPQPLNHYGDCVEMIQGAYLYNSGNFSSLKNGICNKYPIPCKGGDKVKIITETARNQVVVFMNNGTYASYGNITSVTENEYTAPSGATHFLFTISDTVDELTADMVGKIQLTVNGKYVNCIKTQYLAEMTQGYRNVDTGAIASSDAYLTSKNIIPCKVGDSIKIECEDVKGSIVAFYYNGDAYVSYSTKYNVANVEFIVPSGVDGFAFYIGYGKSVTPQTAGKVALTINGKGESLAWYYTNEPTRLGDVKFKDSDGLFKIQRNVVEEVINGNHANINVSSSISNDNRLGLYITSNNQCKTASHGVDALCDRFTKTRHYEIANDLTKCGFWVGDTIFSSNQYIVLIIPKSIAQDLESAKAWLNENPTTVQFPLAIPTIEVLDTQSQINLNSIETFNGVTYLECDSRVQPLGIECEYGTTQVGAYTIKTLLNTENNSIKINELAVSMVALGSEV